MIFAGFQIAVAGTGIDGSTGLVRLPTVDTVPRAEVRASLGVQLLRRYPGFSVEGVPVGFAAGLTRRIEVGGHLDREALSPADPLLLPASAAVHLRTRVVDPHRSRPGLAIQGSLGGLGPAAVTAEGALIAAVDLRSLHLTLAAGPRARSGRGLALWQGGGLALDVGPVGLAAEHRSAIGSAGALEQIEGRGAVSLALRDRVGLIGWAGGGVYDLAPWAGGGVALQLASSEVRRQDVDGDGVVDRWDWCRFEAEDLDGFDDNDGCIDPDNDGDGIPDADDPTPNGEPDEPDPADLPGDTPTLKMRIKPRPLPGPIDPTHRADPGRTP